MEHLEAKIRKRLKELQAFTPLKKEKSLKEEIEERFSRRDFLKWAIAMAAMLSLPPTMAPVVAEAAELADRLPVIWLHMAECTGCTESLLRSDAPSIDNLIFEYVSLEYQETLMAAAGWQAEENLEHAIEKYKGRYVLMVEGGIPTANEGYYLTLGGHGKTGKEIVQEAAAKAAVVFAIGTCSAFGGIQAAHPNPTGSVALSKVTHRPVINVAGCPPSEKNIVGSLIPNFSLENDRIA